MPSANYPSWDHRIAPEYALIVFVVVALVGIVISIMPW